MEEAEACTWCWKGPCQPDTRSLALSHREAPHSAGPSGSQSLRLRSRRVQYTRSPHVRTPRGDVHMPGTGKNTHSHLSTPHPLRQELVSWGWTLCLWELWPWAEHTRHFSV